MFVASDDEFRAELLGRYDMTVRLWCWPPLGVMSRRKLAGWIPGFDGSGMCGKFLYFAH